jgi:tetratricopeptide (TPR) repeat protein
VYREFAARHPESATLRRDLAQTLRAMGRREEARQVLEAVLEMAPCEAAARVELARLLGELRELGRQLEVLRGGVGTCSESDALLNQYAFALATNPRSELRDGEEAVRAARRALELGGDDRPMLLDTLAAAHAEAGDFHEALRVSDLAIAVAEHQRRSAELLASLRRSRASFQQGQPLRLE